MITAASTLTFPSQAEIQAALMAGPLPGDTAILFPVSGKKALVLTARWGTVTTDSGPMDWLKSHSAALRSLLRLRELGFKESGFTESLPPLVTLRTLGRDDRHEAQNLWRSLAAVREDRTFLPLVTKISRSGK